MADDAKLIAVVEANTKQIESAMKRLVPIIKGSTDQMTASVKKLDQQVGLVGKSMSRLGKAFTVTAAVAAAKQLASAFGEVVDRADQLVDTADKLGITTASLKALRYAAEQAGSSAGQMDEALAKLSKGLAEARAGTGDLRKLLIANGMKEAEIQSLTLEKALAKVADLIHGSADASNAAKVAMLAFGRGNDELAVTFKDGSKAIRIYTDEFNRLHTEISEEGERKLAGYKDELVRLNSMWDAAVDHMTLYALTAMEKMGLVAQAAYEHVGRVAAGAERAGLSDMINRREQLLKEINEPVGTGFAAQWANRPEARQAKIDEMFKLDVAIAQEYQRLYNEMEIQRAAARGYGAKVPADYVPSPTDPTVVPGKTDTGGGGGPKFGGEVRQLQASVAAKRRLPLDQEVLSILEAASKKAGVIVEVRSGGQAAIGTGGPRTGSIRHDLGRAADVWLRDPVTGKMLNPSNPADLARIKDFIAASASAGATGIGFGPGYMKPPGGIHVGMGKQATWGGAPWLAGVVAAGRANPMFVEGREQARLSKADEETQKAIDNQQELNEKAVEGSKALFDYHNALAQINQEFKRDLLGGFIRDLERGVKPAEALANALMKIGDMLLDQALKAIFPDIVAPIFGAALAGGGVMTNRGPMPLKRYAGGGIAHSPQVALFGEGGRPEAYVPLPDGRRIPVNIRVPGMGGLGGGRGGQGVAVHNRVTVDPSPLFVVTTHEVARQAGHAAVAEAGDGARRRPGGR